MATYDLKYPGAAIDAILDTAYDLQNAGYIFRGLASEYSNTPTERSWVLAGEGETGHGFTSPIPKGYIGVCVFNGTSWTGKLLKCVSIDSAPTPGSTNAVSSGGAYAALNQLATGVAEALDNMAFTDVTPPADQYNQLKLKLATTDSGIERIITYLTFLSATASKAGLLSAADKAKLDAILGNLRSLEIDDTTAYADLGDKIVESIKATIGGTEETISTFQILAATASKAGLLSAADKAKLDALWSSGYQFAGIATPSTTPVSTTSKIFYIATEAGTYFNAVTVTQGINILSWDGSAWSAVQVIGIDNVPTAGSDNLVKSGGVANELFKITGVKSHIQKVKKLDADWIYHISTFSGLQGQKAKVTLKDPNGALTGATFYYGNSTTGSYFFLNSGESKVITFPIDFTELSMYVGNSWVITQNSADVEIIFEYDTGTEYRLEDLEKKEPQIETKLNELVEALSKNIDITNDLIVGVLPGYIEKNGTITANATWFYKTLLLKKGQTITVDAATGDYPKLGIAQSGTVEVGDTVTVVSGNSYTASVDTWIVVSEGSKLLSAIITESTNLFQTADNNPDFNSSNIVSSKGIADSLKNIKADGRIKQKSSLLLYKAGLSYKLNTNLSAKNGDTIIVTIIDNDNVLPSGYSMALYHGDPGNSVPYTNIPVGVPTEITLNLDVNNFFLYVITSELTKTGYITLKLDYKNLFVTKSEFDAIEKKCEMPFDSIVSLNSAVSFTYDSGITLEAGREIEVTLIDEGGIVKESLPLYRNSTSGSYVNLVPGVPTKIQASEQTHFLLYVASSWISASGNVTLHVEYINTSDIIDVTLPSKAYAYVGGEFNIYNENVAYITQKDRYYVYWVIDDIADYKVYSDRLRLMPTDEMIGTHTVTLQIWDRYNIAMVYSKALTLEVVANSAVSNKKVLFIGDSLTNAGYYPHFIEYLSNNGIQSIGTRESEVWSSFAEGERVIVHHEGRGGWSARDYVRNYPDYRTDAPNPFWNPSTEKFDFSYYMTEQGYSTPDAVFINLGTNDAGFLTSQVNAIKEMISSIHAYNNTIPIFVHLINPPATQDGWAYTGHGDSYAFDALVRAERKEYLKEFENKIDNVFITPMYLNIDRYYDYATVEEQVSQRNPTLVVRQTNNVHPSRYGYYKFADVYYADLMHILS